MKKYIFCDFFKFFSLFLLTNGRKNAKIIKYSERWLSWSKAHDWKSCNG